MGKYIIRLDDACEKRDIERWDKIENLLDKYEVKPLVGVIPHCEDPKMDEYPFDDNFWEKVHGWEQKGWCIAMHGYNHVYLTECGGLNPVNHKSEFAGEPLQVQKQKIRDGIAIFRQHDIEPKVFFAPSHTFDENTLIALKQESDIRTISDTIAYNVYDKYGMRFVPQQSGRVRPLPFKTVTFCYHPNVMDEQDFICLEHFMQRYIKCFLGFDDVCNSVNKTTWFDSLLNKIYFMKRK